MISEDEIKRKDFSFAIAAIVGKLDIVSYLNEMDGATGLTMLDILESSIEELKLINETLYGYGKENYKEM